MKRSIKIFLRVLLSVLVLLTTLLVFTQTSIFKSWLRDTILAQVNQNIQGRLTVESLSGNLFTTISLNNLQLAGSGDTVMVIEQIKVNYDFLKLLNKERYSHVMDCCHDPGFGLFPLCSRPACHPCDLHECHEFVCLPDLRPVQVAGAARRLLSDSAASEARR